MGAMRKRRASPKGPGYTIRQFALAVDASEHLVRSLVHQGTIESVEMNGVRRIPPRERERWIAQWGEPASSQQAQPSA